MFESKEIIYLFIFIAILLSSMSLLLVYLNQKRMHSERNFYNDELNRIEVEKDRQFYENKIYQLNARLAQDNNRWNDTNNLIFNSQKYNFDQGENNNLINVNSFIKSAGLSVDELRIDKDLIFMLTPFNELEWKTFEIVKKACAKLEFKCIRADEKNITGDILPSIIKSILESQIVIVNINGRNPNVFYELGIAHALGKKTILISKFGEELPFDIRSKNIVLYNSNEELSEKITSAIVKLIRE